MYLQSYVFTFEKVMVLGEEITDELILAEESEEELEKNEQHETEFTLIFINWMGICNKLLNRQKDRSDEHSVVSSSRSSSLVKLPQIQLLQKFNGSPGNWQTL